MRFFAIFHTANRFRGAISQGDSILKIATTRQPTYRFPKLTVNDRDIKTFSSLSQTGPGSSKSIQREILTSRFYQTTERMVNPVVYKISKNYLDRLKYVIPIFLFASIMMQNVLFAEEPKEEEFSYNETFNKLFNLLHRGETKEVFVKLIQIAKEYPALSEALLDIESCRFDEGMEKLEKILIKQFKSNSPFLVLKGLLYLSTDCLEEALTCFEQVVQQTDSVYLKSIALLHKSKVLEFQKKFFQADEAEKIAHQYYGSSKMLCDYKTIKYFIQSYYDEYKSLSSLKQEERETLLKNRVVIRVWYPSRHYVQSSPINVVKSYFSNSPVSVGHASLEAQSYISFWPIASVNVEPVIPNTNQIGYFNSFFDDILVESTPPDVRIALYTLDSAAIEVAFREFKEKNITWDLYASTFLFKNPDIANCSSMVNDLLYAAGIEQLITFNFINMFKFAHRGLIGEWVEKYFGENGLRVAKFISLLSSLYLTGAYNAIPPQAIFPIPYSIGAGAVLGAFDAGRAYIDNEDSSTVLKEALSGFFRGPLVTLPINHFLIYCCPP